MILREIMTKKVETIHPTASLQEAAEKMRTGNIGSLPVCDGPGVLGMITDRDITVDAVASGMDPTSTHVSDAMTHGAIYCYDDQDITEAARVMQGHQVRRLLVMSRDKQLVGVVALADLALENPDTDTNAAVLTEVSRPS